MAILASNVPVKRQVTNIAHGQVGEYAASRMLCIRKNKKKCRLEKASFLQPAFFRFHCAREIAFPLPQASCGNSKVS
ncbi:MAG: hypothetical protein E7329_04395 [Clostridiales bacterium]|nr:hypothetical protein [Clostridiales bacterium]